MVSATPTDLFDKEGLRPLLNLPRGLTLGASQGGGIKDAAPQAVSLKCIKAGGVFVSRGG